MKEAILEDFVERANNNVDSDFLHLVTALDPQWEDLKLNNKSDRGGGAHAQAESQAGLAEGQEDVSRDKVDVPKPKRRLTSTKLTMTVMERARWMSSPGFEILTFANGLLNCCNRY